MAYLPILMVLARGIVFIVRYSSLRAVYFIKTSQYFIPMVFNKWKINLKGYPSL